MKVKLDKQLINVEGFPWKEGGKEVTLKWICMNAIIQPSEGDSAEKKVLKWEIFKKILNSSDVVELTAEEISLLKSEIAKNPLPLVVGQCFEMLEE